MGGSNSYAGGTTPECRSVFSVPWARSRWPTPRRWAAGLLTLTNGILQNHGRGRGSRSLSGWSFSGGIVGLGLAPIRLASPTRRCPYNTMAKGYVDANRQHADHHQRRPGAAAGNLTTLATVGAHVGVVCDGLRHADSVTQADSLHFGATIVSGGTMVLTKGGGSIPEYQFPQR